MKKIIDLLFRSKIRASVSIFAVISIAIGFAIGPYYGFFYCKGSSMVPTIRDGEWIVLQKSALIKDWEPLYGDIVIIDSKKEDDTLIKRIIGTPGDTIQIIEGNIHLNGKVYKDVFTHKAIERVDYAKILLLKDEYWVIGDNRDETFYGLVRLPEMSGLVIW